MDKTPKLNPIPNPVRAVIIGAWVAALVWCEQRRRLRPVRDNKVHRDVRNLAVAASAGAVMQFAETPVALGLVKWTANRNCGLAKRLPFSPVMQGLASVLMLDYTLYVWHVMTHRVPLLWRFHKAHHIDREMDASTALRFHFGEIGISVAFRAAQIIVIGPSGMAFACWQVFLFLCILFHHSNVRLPRHWEQRLARVVMTPRLHAIHHSIEPDLVNSNWSSGLTVWDWLHRTLRTNVPQSELVLGVPGHLDDNSQRLLNVLLVPFTETPNVPASAA